MSQSVKPSSIHNAQVLDRLRAATEVAETLARRGFILIDVQLGLRNPVVWVEHTSECQTLKAAYCVANLIGVIMAAPVDGVQVQWQQRRLAS